METPLPSMPQVVAQPTPLPTPSNAANPNATVTAAIPAVVQSAGTGVLSEILPRSPAIATDAGGNAEALPAIPGAKLRLMCSYGGHIMPRPHDKALTYVGGETRLVVVDRHSSLASLRSRLSRMLLNGRAFTLKYQLPNEDLDSLVSITMDEDLENMIEEYDRVTSSAATPVTAAAPASQRIRLFLFANKLETAATMGSLLEGAKSETWFVDALNQSGLLPRGLSDSAAVDNCLLNLDDASAGEATEMQTLETNIGGENNKLADLVANGAIPHNEIHLSSMPDSPMLENASSSFGSSSSTPSMANLPPIRVRVCEEQRIDEQFAQMNFSNVHIQRHLEDGVGAAVARPQIILPASVTDAAAISNAVPDSSVCVMGGGCHVPSDDDRTDQGLSSGYQKPPLPLQQVAVPPRTGGGYGLRSPDSVASDSSNSSATSFLKPMYYQEQAQAPPRTPGTQPELTSVQNSQVPVQPVSYAPVDHHQPAQVQQPFVHHGVQYIPHPSQYIPVYPHQQQNYPVYMMPVPHSQPYISIGTPPLYPNSKHATIPKPEAAQNVYRTGVPPNPHVHQLQQQQPQYVGYTGVPHHTTNANANYSGYEFSKSPSEPTYYRAQPPVSVAGGAIPMGSQYQSMTPAAAAAALVDASKQMALDSTKQHIASSATQPI